MVSDGEYRDRSGITGERAQLLLVGAIALALVLIGLVVVFNTVLYTEATTPTETLESADEAEILDQQVRNDTERMMKVVANRSTNSTGVLEPTEFDPNLTNNMTMYGERLGQSKGHTGPVFVRVQVANVGINGSSPCPGSEELCVEYTFVYSTEEFTYERTRVVTTDTPGTVALPP